MGDEGARNLSDVRRASRAPVRVARNTTGERAPGRRRTPARTAADVALSRRPCAGSCPQAATQS
ncbi:hypothetical protein GCM10010220_39180 [Streptomyces parvulus]|nr:hypothetical protein GCM10010220_39180 [Streptomyces parvulus]